MNQSQRILPNRSTLISKRNFDKLMQRKVVTHLAIPLPLFIHTQQCRQLHQQLHHEQHTNSIHKPINYDFSKILILNKITRYEFEKLRNPHLNEIELKEKLTRKGSNFERLIEHHNTHMRSLEKIIKTLKDYRIDTRVTQRYNYTYDDINWSNCVLTAGGDGTFLMAAAKVNTQTKPVIGINTDVTSSEGHLLLPKNQSINFAETFSRILNGKFQWVLRARIRIVLEGHNLSLQPIELHDQVLNNLEHRYVEHIEESRTTKLNNLDPLGKEQTSQTYESIKEKINEDKNKWSVYEVPTRALNEVFIGESLSARVSYYQMSIDDSPFFKQKSSGIIVCTGTGSTSWCYNINKMSVQSMKKIMQLAKNELSKSTNKQVLNQLDIDTDEFVQRITNNFNDSIVFKPDQLRMAYTIRDPIINRIFLNETNRGFAEKMVIQSRCFDAVLVIDGGCSYQFNDGAKASFYTLPEDSLRTVLVL